MRWREEQGTQSKGIDNKTVRRFCPGRPSNKLTTSLPFRFYNTELAQLMKYTFFVLQSDT